MAKRNDQLTISLPRRYRAALVAAQGESLSAKVRWLIEENGVTKSALASSQEATPAAR
jgi:hypothetical protein